MEKKLYEALVKLDNALAAYLKAHHVDVTRVTPQKVAFMCTTCGGVFHVVPGGLRCSGTCGEFVRVRWADGREMSLVDLYRYMRSLDDKAA